MSPRRSASSSPRLLTARFERVVSELALPEGAALVAVSGGPDSLALLDLLANAKALQSLRFVVAHFDHGIHPASAAVAERVRGLAERYALPFERERAELGAAATETSARRHRRAWLLARAEALSASTIFTAHHRDDQVETLLMRFLRGSGPAGLAGMPIRHGRWVRPLLEFSKAELEAHLRARDLEGWEDPANRDPRHLRGWLRTEVLPLLEQRLPRIRDDLLTAQRVSEEQRAAWDRLLFELPNLDVGLEPHAVSVAASSLHGYSSTIARMLIRALALRLELGVGRAEVDRLELLLRQGHTGQTIDLRAGARAELSFGRLRLFRCPVHPTDGSTRLLGEAGRAEWGNWVLEWRPEVGVQPIERREWTTRVESGADLLLREWRPGDRVRPLGGRGSRLVVRCMQDAKIARSRRPGWPVVEWNGQVVWVPGVCRADLLVPAPAEKATRIDASAR